jgi:membrane-associated phospholipid phosphatase
MIAALAVTAVGLALFATETVVIAGDRGPTALDESVLDAVHNLENGTVVAIAKIVTVLGALPVTATVAVIAAVGLRRRPTEVAVLVASAVAIFIAVHVTKAATDRPRPPDPLAGATLSAFPSGHAAYSTIYVAAALAIARTTLATRRTALIAAAIVLALAIGATRLYLRVHWATDVLGGWALGAAIFGAATAIGLAVGRFRNNDPRNVEWP